MAYISKEMVIKHIKDTYEEIPLDVGSRQLIAALKTYIENVPTADVVEIEILRDWLWEIALNNAGGDFPIACQDIISRLDGLRKFAQERRNV